MREYDPTYDYQADPIAILYIRSNLRLVTDLQTCVKAQQSQAYGIVGIAKIPIARDERTSFKANTQKVIFQKC